MNTKTMRLPPRRVLTPSAAPISIKRKERDEGLERPRPRPIPIPSPNSPSTSNPTKFVKPDKPRASSAKGSEPTSSNQLLAGFLAHEFLTKGTLLGEPWDPSRASGGPSEDDGRKGRSSQTREAEPERQERYAELAGLMRASGIHAPGIVNPAQLSRFLRL